MLKKVLLPITAMAMSSLAIASDSNNNLEKRVEQLEAQVKFLSTLMTRVQNNQNVIAKNVGLIKDEKIEAGQPVPLFGFLDGKKDSKVFVMEFTDQECPYCRTFSVAEYPKIKEELISKGKVSFLHLQKPLNIHPNAFNASKQIFCAAEQGKYLEAKKEMFMNADYVKQQRYKDSLNNVELDWAKMEKCLVSTRPLDRLAKDEDLAERLNISQTPSFVIGRKEGNELVDWELVTGNLTVDELTKKIEVLDKK